MYTDISKLFLCMNIIRHVYTFKKWRNYVNTTILYQFMIIFVPFLRANFGQKYKQKIVYFCLILGKIQQVAKEKLVEFVTLDIFKLYMSNKADRLVQKCSKLIFKCFTPNHAKWHDSCRIGLYKKKSGSAWPPLHSQMPVFAKIRGHHCRPCLMSVRVW